MTLELGMEWNSRMPKRVLFLVLFICILSFSVRPAAAQESGPVYIVQSGDTLLQIADRFNLTLGELISANPSINPDFLSEGQEIVIPGLEGVTGVLETEIITFGDSLRSLSRRTQVSDEQLKKLNRLVSPTELYVGVSLVVPTQAQQNPLRTRITASKGESLLELAVQQGSDPWTLASVNKLSGTWNTLPGDILYSPIGTSTENATGYHPLF